MVTVETTSLLFFNDTATTEIYTLSLHDALPILRSASELVDLEDRQQNRHDDRQHDETHDDDQERLEDAQHRGEQAVQDRKSTRLNSSHSQISYAVFCLKKKKQKKLEQ